VTPARYAGIAASAILMVVMFPSADLGFLAWVAIVPLLLAIGDLPARTWGAGAFVAFLFAKGGTLYWLVYTMHHYGYIHIVASVAIYLLLVTVIALLWGLTFAGTHALAHRAGVPLFLALPVAWVTNEWVQTWLLSGFPWMLLGYAPYRWRTMIQSADLLGVWGMAFLVVLANVAVFEIASFAAKRRERFPIAANATAVVLIAGALVYGHFRLRQVEAAMAAETPLKVAVLQGNIDQTEKWRDAKVRARTPKMYLDMAVEANRNHDLALILLPETAIPVWQDRDDPELEPRIARLGIETGTYVLTGCPTRGTEGGPRRINYNSAVLVSPEGKAAGWYHKNRLVPFGEYIPLKDFLEKILGGLVAGTGNFRPWGRFSLMEIPQGPMAVMICYETIFPDLVRTIVNQGAAFLPTITNDAWFGNTSAPHQHLAMVAVRAIENRRYVPRAANTGISGIVDPTGRVLFRTPVYEKASYTGEIRPMHLTTLYGRVGDALAYACATVSLVLGAWITVRARRAAPKRRKP
jgi:apolipoprotein N-acyltransferase